MPQSKQLLILINRSDMVNALAQYSSVLQPQQIATEVSDSYCV